MNIILLTRELEIKHMEHEQRLRHKTQAFDEKSQSLKQNTEAEINKYKEKLRSLQEFSQELAINFEESKCEKAKQLTNIECENLKIKGKILELENQIMTIYNKLKDKKLEEDRCKKQLERRIEAEKDEEYNRITIEKEVHRDRVCSKLEYQKEKIKELLEDIKNTEEEEIRYRKYSGNKIVALKKAINEINKKSEEIEEKMYRLVEKKQALEQKVHKYIYSIPFLKTKLNKLKSKNRKLFKKNSMLQDMIYKKPLK